MWTRGLAATLLTLLALGAAPAGAESPEAAPAAHEELNRALEDLAGQLHGLGTRWRDHFVPSEPRGERPLITLILRHKDEFGLSADQVQTLERLRTDFQREAIRRDADIRVAETELAPLLDADPVDLGQVEAKIREIERLRADLRLARARAIEQGKAQLTADQRARLRTFLAAPRGPRLRTDPPTPPRGERHLGSPELL
jgi:Spy/CpxP family protein refolding chaperone